MDFTSNNNLSMTGGDQFTDIDGILARCVLLDENQTIVSSKIFDSSTTTTFDGVVDFNGSANMNGSVSNTAIFTNEATGTMTNLGSFINDPTATFDLDGTFNLRTDIIGDKPTLTFSNTGDTSITATNNITSTAGAQNTMTSATQNTMLATSGINAIDNTSGQNRMLNASGSNIIETTTTGNNIMRTTTGQNLITNTGAGSNLISTTGAGTNTLYAVGVGGQNIIDGTSNKVRVGGTDKLNIAPTLTKNTNTTITELATSAFQVQNVDGTDKLNIAPTLTKNTNATITELATSAFKVQNVDGTDKLNIAPTLTKNTNATITELATSAFKVQNVDGTDKLNIAPTLTTINNTTIDIQAGGVSKFNATSSITSIDNPSQVRLKINTATKIFLDSANTQINNDNVSLITSSVTKYAHNASATTLKNATISLQDSTPTTRFTQNDGSTAITNTAIALTGTTGALDLTTTTGKASIISTSGLVELKTGSSSATGINIENTNLSTGGIKIKTNGSAGDIKFTSNDEINVTAGTNLTLSATTIPITTTTGKASIISTSGVIELKTGALTNTGINIENTNATTGGITLKTAGTTGDIVLTCRDDITMTTDNADGIISLINTAVTGIGARNAIQLKTTANNSDILISTTGSGANMAISAPLGVIATTALINRVVSSASSTAGANKMESTGTASTNLIQTTGDGSETYITGTGANSLITLETAGTTGTISLKSNSITKMRVTSSLTTITNTSINLTGNVYASSYSIGTSVSNARLFSFQIHGTKQGADANGTCILNPMYDTTLNRCFNYRMPCHVVFTKVTIMFDIDSATSTTMTLKFIKRTTNGGAETTLGFSPGFTTFVNNTISYSQVVNITSPTLLIGAEYQAGELMQVEYTTSPTNEWGIVFHGYQL